MTQDVAITPHAIRRRAHERWLERGAPAGSPEHDWFEAERELAEATRAQAAQARTAPVAAPAAPLPRRRGPRSLVTRAGSAPAARLLAALVPEAAPELVRVVGQRRR